MKNLTYLVLLIWSLTAEAATLIPLDSYIQERPKWHEDISELVYVGTRCDCLYTTIGNWAVGNGREQAKSYGRKLLESAEIFRSVYTALSFEVNMNQSSIEKRFQEVVSVYTDKVVENKRLNNNVFDGYVGKDIEVCKKNLPLYEAINSKFKR